MLFDPDPHMKLISLIIDLKSTPTTDGSSIRRGLTLMELVSHRNTAVLQSEASVTS